MVISRNLTTFGILGAALISLGLFQVKYIVLDLEGQLQGIHRDIFNIQDSMHILQAEYAHLKAPERLETLAKKHLDLGPVKSWQFINLKDIPLRPEVTTSQGAKTMDSLLQSLIDQPLNQNQDSRQGRGKNDLP